MFSAATKTATPTGVSANYIEDVFSTYLYTGTGSSQTITNNIDTTNYGGLVWIKGRTGTTGHRFTDTVRGTTKSLASDSTAAEATESTGLTAFGTTGFTIGADGDYNTNTQTYASWAFREQAKFFDVVTYTGNGSNRTISHNLGSVPGCIIIKRTDTIGSWAVYHRSLANTEYVLLNSTAAKATGATYWNSTTATSTEFSLGTATDVNANAGTYVAYIFAHDAGGFGLTGADNVISCGTYTTDGSGNATISLGYEPQWVMVKKTTGSADNWWMFDNMRGMLVPGQASRYFYANTTGAEANATLIGPTATGFVHQAYQASSTFIYIAIRRGPMEKPTSGTSVFAPVLETPISGSTTITSGFPVDLGVAQRRATGGSNNLVNDRLRGNIRTSASFLFTNYLSTQLTNAEATSSNTSGLSFQNNTGIIDAAWLYDNWGWTDASVWWLFGRAPSFFDIVCYTGTGSATTVTHNLGAAPELMLVKRRGTSNAWAVYANNDNTDYLVLNTTAATVDDITYWNDTSPTSSVFSVGTNNATNASGSTYAAYLFATCPGVSKVGSYTGTGTTLQVNCGFTGGARFVLIKRTDSTGDWYVWDSARGIVAGNDPYLLLNSTAAEVTSTDYVDTYSAGFEISSTAPAAINANGGNFIFLAIA